jgi:hypothetical protein
MKMKLLLSLFGVMFALTAFSQLPKGYQKYADLINKAEISAIDGAYSHATDLYAAAFKSHAPFGKDLYNAALCALRSGSRDKAKDYLVRLLEKGLEPARLKQDTVFNALWNDTDSSWMASVKPKKFNIVQRKTLDSLFEADQYFRLKAPGNYQRSQWKDTIRSTDSINVLALRNIIARGFPSEFSAGLYGERATTDMLWYVLLMHQGRSTPNRFYDFSGAILEAMRSGQILAHRGAALYKLTNGADTLFGSGFIYKVTEGKTAMFYYQSLSPEKEQAKDKSRRAYGLESLADYRKKVKYYLGHKDLKFDFKMGEDVETVEAEVVRQFMKNLKEL